MLPWLLKIFTSTPLWFGGRQPPRVLNCLHSGRRPIATVVPSPYSEKSYTFYYSHVIIVHVYLWMDLNLPKIRMLLETVSAWAGVCKVSQSKFVRCKSHRIRLPWSYLLRNKKIRTFEVIGSKHVPPDIETSLLPTRLCFFFTYPY